MSITYDSTELVNATYIPRYAKHESAPARSVNTLKLAKQDGEVVIDDTYGMKYIDIRGILKGSSKSDLETKIDSFKELIGRKDKNLDIAWAGGTRRYVCRAISHEFNRDFFHLLHCPYTIRFLIPTGYGKNTSVTTAYDQASITAAQLQNTVAFLGSYSPKPKHKITLTTRGNADVVRISNEDTGDYMEVDLDGFVDTDYLEIDEENLTVKKNGTTNLEYRGKFPSVVIGNNELKITFYGSGSTLDAYQDLVTVGANSIFYDNASYIPNQAQSFIPLQSGRLYKLAFYLNKSGSPTGKMQWHIQYDDNGKPMSGSAGRVSDEEFELVSSIPSGGFQEVLKASGSSPFLKKGQKYWIVLDGTEITGSSANDYLMWRYYEDGTNYVNGKAMTQEGAAADWEDGSSNAGSGNVAGQFDMTFKVYRGDNAAASHTITWQIYYTQKYL